MAASELGGATVALAERRDELLADGVAARVAAFSSPSPGRDIARLVLSSGLATVATGLAGGCLMAFALTRYLRSSLFGVSAADPLTFSAVTVALFGVTLAAQAVPAARAMRVDPVVALRQD